MVSVDNTSTEWQTKYKYVGIVQAAKNDSVKPAGCFWKSLSSPMRFTAIDSYNTKALNFTDEVSAVKFATSARTENPSQDISWWKTLVEVYEEDQSNLNTFNGLRAELDSYTEKMSELTDERDTLLTAISEFDPEAIDKCMNEVRDMLKAGKVPGMQFATKMKDLLKVKGNVKRLRDALSACDKELGDISKKSRVVSEKLEQARDTVKVSNDKFETQLFKTGETIELS